MPAASFALAATILMGALLPASADSARSDPGSALCLENGATVTSETLPNGAKRAVCVFPNGSRIEAGTYFRNKHRTH